MNQSLLASTDLLQVFILVFLRSRPFKYADSADIEEMFLHVVILKIDQVSQRLLWLRAPANYNKIYEKLPAAASAVQDIFNMEDLLGSIADSNAALKLSEDLVNLLILEGLILSKFVNNVPDSAEF